MVFKRNYAIYNIGNIKKDLQQLWRTETTEANVNNVWNTFKRLSEMVTDKHAPLVQNRIRDRNRPWFTNETQKKINERDFCGENHEKQENAMTGYMYRRLRSAAIRSVRYSKAAHKRTIMQEHMDRPNQF